MRNGILGRTGKLAVVMGAALLFSTTAFAGTPSLGAGCGARREHHRLGYSRQGYAGTDNTSAC